MICEPLSQGSRVSGRTKSLDTSSLAGATSYQSRRLDSRLGQEVRTAQRDRGSLRRPTALRMPAPRRGRCSALQTMIRRSFETGH